MTMAQDPSTAPSYKWVGTRTVRPDGYDKVTGKARFGADLNLTNMLEGAVARSPHAHARIVAIDTSAALEMPGVKAVITGADFPDLAEAGAGQGDIDQSHKVIARDKVLFVGHPVAAVAATTRAQARAAAATIQVSYEVLDHVLTAEQATATDAVILHDWMRTTGVEPAPQVASNIAARNVFERGDTAAGFAAADQVIEREFTTKSVHQGYIEPHAAVADAAPGTDRAHLWVSSQGHFEMRSMSASVLGWDVSQLKVTPAEIGGGFGGKTTIYLEPLAVKLSTKAGRPVRLVMSRNEVFEATGPTSQATMKIKMGADDQGKITACEMEIVFEAGAFPGSSINAALMTALACYDVDNFYLEGFDVVTNTPKTAAYRAPGAPISAFAVESVIDELALALNMDPIDMRLENAAVEGTQAPYGPRFDRIGMVDTLEAIRDSDHYNAPLGPNQGRGVASGFWFNIGGNSTATVHVAEDGNVAVMVGSPDIGGSRASMALFAAEELGIDVDRIQPQVADTESIGYNDVTGGSRVTLATGRVVIDACRIVVSDLRARAAKTWDCELEEVEWVDGQAQHVAGTEPALTLAALAADAGRTGGPISATASDNVRGAGPGFSTQVVDVEVDPETGVSTILRYTTAQDAGKAVHPSYVEGQMQGGVVQGIGWALNEEYVTRPDGSVDNASFLDYRMPVASDLPMIDTIVVEVPNPKHPYGVRGVGEVGIVPPVAAVANAVGRAVDRRFTGVPLSPMVVLESIRGGEPATGADPT